MPTLDDPFIGVDEVAKMFGTSPVQVRQWIRDGKMDGRKIMGRWRVLTSEVKRVANEEYGE